MRIKLFFVLTFILPSRFLLANDPEIPSPWNWHVTSDFGPRILTNYDFHEGIDFNRLPGNGDFGTPIPAIEAGIITAIATRGPFYNIDVNSGLNRNWLYGHIFKLNQHRKDEWELKLGATAIDPQEPTTTLTKNIIILWQDSQTTTIATKIFADEADLYIRRNATSFILGPNGQPLLTKNLVGQNEEIAIMGNANATTVPVHLHLGLNYPNDNPFRHLRHAISNNMQTNIMIPSANQEISGTELATPFAFKVEVDSRGTFDLDKIQMWIEINQDPQNKFIFPSNFSHTFQFGGVPGQATSNTVVAYMGTHTGVSPYNYGSSGSPETLGRDDFIFYQNLNVIPSGLHRFALSCKDVNDNEGCANSSVVFRIRKCDSGLDTEPPQITLDPSALQCINQPGSFDLKGIVSDNCSDPQLRLDNGPLEQLVATSNPHEFSFSISLPLEEGANLFTLTAIDASSQTLQFPVTLNYDTEPPFVVTFLPAPGALNVNPSTPIQAVFNEPLSSGEIHIEGASVAGTSQISGNVVSFNHGPLPPDATFRVRVKNAMDMCGNCPE